MPGFLMQQNAIDHSLWNNNIARQGAMKEMIWDSC